MEKTVEIQSGIEAKLDGFRVSIKGSKGTLERDFDSALYNKNLKMEMKDNLILISTKSDKRKIKSVVGTIASHIKNMMRGVTDGYTYKLKTVYMHFPFTVKVEGDRVVVANFLGEKSLRKAKIIGDTKVEIKGDVITVSGINKEDAGQTASNIEKATFVSARDRRIFQDGIFLTGSD